MRTRERASQELQAQLRGLLGADNTTTTTTTIQNSKIFTRGARGTENRCHMATP